MIGAVWSAVLMKDEKYYFFESHSHGKDGLSGPDDSSVLLSFDNIEDLITYLYELYESMGIELSLQFETLPIDFTTIPQEAYKMTCIEKQEDCKRVSYKKTPISERQNTLKQDKDHNNSSTQF